MSNPNPLPEGRVRLSDIPGPKVAEVLPKHKAFVIYWMFYAELARENAANKEKKELIAAYTSTIAKNFSWSFHQVKATKESIAKYYEEAKHNAKAYGIPWDEQAVAMIIKSQVPDVETFNKIRSFMESGDTSKVPEPARTVVQAVQETAQKKSKLLRHWYDDFVPGSENSSYLSNLDPKLEQVHETAQAPVTFETMVQAKADRDLWDDGSED